MPKLNNKLKGLSDESLFFPLIYWLIMIAWQNIFPDLTDTGIDSIVKVALLTGLLLYFCFNDNAKINAPNVFFLALFIINMMISFFVEFSLSMRSLINYFFPIILLFGIVFIEADYKLSAKKLIRIFNVIIIAVWFMAIYSLIFKFDHFSSAFSISSAYGNELSSFFVSNHEYALYLTAAICGCLICINIDKTCSKYKKTFYFVSVIVFIINLVLTYSRSYILTTVTFILLFVFLSKNKKLIISFTVAVIVLVLIFLLVPTINSYILDIVFKKNNLADRDILLQESLKIFKSGSLVNQIWGFNTQNFVSVLEDNVGHSSSHNAYLQIIMTYGLANFAIFIGFIAFQIVSVLKLIKSNILVISSCLALTVMSLIPMLTTTIVLFSSVADSYFLTLLCVMIPRFVANAVRDGEFFEQEPTPEISQ